MKSKKNMLYAGIILLLIAGAVFLLLNSGGVAIASGNGNSDVQVVKLYVQNGDYVLEPSEFKQGMRIRLEADMTKMPGCSRSIVIPAFGISKTVTTSDNSIEFVADKAGTFNIACSMNMYRGSFTVLDNNGKKIDNVEKQSGVGASCGVGGGCGCGGTR